MQFRREGFVQSVDGIRAAGGSVGLKLTFCDMVDGKPVPFVVLPSGTRINPAPALTIFRARKGDVEKNMEINLEMLEKLGYTGDGKSAPKVHEFRCGVTHPNARAVEIVFHSTEYGNEVKTVRGHESDEDCAKSFFTGEMPEPEKDDPFPPTAPEPEKKKK